MRILLTADPFIAVPPRLYGGIERIIDALARGLMADGVEVGLLAHADSDCQVTAAFAWPAAAPDSWRAHWRNARALAAAVQSFRPQLVHSFSRLAYLAPVLPARIPKLMSYQRAPSNRAVRWAARIAGDSLRFSGCSEYIAALGRDMAGAWSAIPNFVELDRYQPTATVAADAPLVFLSRVESIKGADTAIAIARGSKRRLLIAGNVPEQPQAAEWFRREVAGAVDGEHIRYIGPVDDREKNVLLGAAAAMVVPIRWDEPFGIVFAEALACGTPVISCPRGAVPEIIESGRHGFLIESVDEGIAAVARLGEISRPACRLRAAEYFSADAVVPKYLALYREMIAAGASP